MKKLTKKILLASLGTAAIAITVPVVLTSCSTDNGNSGGGDQGGGGTGGGDQQTAVSVTAKTDVKVVGSVADLFDKEGKQITVGEMLTNQVKTNNNLKASFVKETLNEKQLAALNVEVKNEKTAELWEGEAEYSAWSTGTKDAYYSSTSPQLTIKSTKDLQTQLSDATKLAEIMKAAGVADTDKTYSLGNSKLNLDTNKDFLEIHVEQNDATTGGTAKATANYKLILPVSDLNFEIEKATVSLTSTDDKLVKVETKDNTSKLTFDVGIDATSQYSKTDAVDVPTATATADEVLKVIGWAKAKEGAVLYDASTDNVTLVNDKISQDTKIFNATFSEVSLNEVDKEQSSYKLTLKATPNSGYSWTDGTNTEKTIETSEFKVTTTPAVANDAKVTDFTYNGEVAVKGATDQDTISALSNWCGLDDYVKTLLNEMLKESDKYAYITISYNGQTSKLAGTENYTASFVATPVDGHAFGDGDATKPFLVTFTQVK